MNPLHRILTLAAGLSVLLSPISAVKGDAVEVHADGTAQQRKPLGAIVNVNPGMEEFSDFPANGVGVGKDKDVKAHTVNVRYCSS